MVMCAVGRPLYLDHFVLREPPFKLTPHTPFFYPGGNRGAILRALLYAAMNTEGVVTVTGEVGTGKTMLARMLIDHRPSSLEIAYIANPAMTRDDIVLTIAQELRIRPTGRTPRELLKALQMKLIELHLEGKRVSVLIDEAHVMSTLAPHEATAESRPVPTRRSEPWNPLTKIASSRRHTAVMPSPPTASPPPSMGHPLSNHEPVPSFVAVPNPPLASD